MKLDFTDQVVIVTGAGSGIGKAAAIDFAKAGAIVVCLDVGSQYRRRYGRPLTVTLQQDL